ncbi:unnamed protein product, partial [Staurois parvus]
MVSPPLVPCDPRLCQVTSVAPAIDTEEPTNYQRQCHVIKSNYHDRR